MKRWLAGFLLVVCTASHGKAADCPIEQLVAQIRDIRGEPARVWIDRGSQHLVAGLKDCIVYDDKVRASPGSFFVLDVPDGSFKGTEWAAPPARPDMHVGFSGYLAKWWDIMTGPVAYSPHYAVGRGEKACSRSRPSNQSRLEPLRDVVGPQVLGADVPEIMAAWQPLRWPGDVGATLRRSDGSVIAEAHVCGPSHLTLPLFPGALTKGEQVMLEIRDGPDSAFSYHIDVVYPSDFPSTPTNFPEEWMTAGWRLLAPPQNTHLDALSRLARAPSDSFGARRILDAVLSNAKP